MDSYLEDILFLYNRDTHWDETFTYSYIIKTTNDLIRFNIPSTPFKLSLSAKTTENSNTFSNFDIFKSQFKNQQLQGHISYIIYNVNESIEVLKQKNRHNNNNNNIMNQDSDINPIIKINQSFKKSLHINDYIKNFSDYYKDLLIGNQNNEVPNSYDYLRTKSYKNSRFLYGKMLFTGDNTGRSITSGMYIKQLSLNTRLMMKFQSDSTTQSLHSTSSLQFQNANKFMELTYNTTETLIGFKLLKKLWNNPIEKSCFKLGFEVWHGFKNFTPHSSISFQYDTVSSQQGKPLNFSMDINPLLGHLIVTFGMWENLHHYDSIHRKRSGMFSHFFLNVYSLKSKLNIGYQYKQLKVAVNFTDRYLRFKHGLQLSDKFTLSFGAVMQLDSDLLNNINPLDNMLNYGLELKYIG
ncbi:hypothetical protein HANVADRAFT_56538 [Hanseniaspora valbyensis NRRL Y-1626]|uniref:Mitochondrial distribution and morphology protein 10 n=1 Tax=Hanseniaspora valbyensis NRRL Y-1626 TaxID=766949 RepID=A0A1B7TC95_9ASCO|nr:hypothetical protein HANVADRAFT_56538 [Hanseniaspora valbyensis NRRL Y-1626]